ncbi:MAG: DUF5668 domain-containing protein [Thermoanaerobaculaceae bacterium]|jgi:hypothetical protein|nr:DUF5668 domain-containing protein [Thermoanaerobaculaceae bacterium]
MSTEQVNQSQQVPPPAAPVPPAAQPTNYAAPRSPQFKSTGAAVVLSFFPGIGHLYLGLYQRAIGFFAAFAFSIFLADKASLGILIPFVWFFGLIDAYRQTLLINAGQTPEDLWANPVRRRTPKNTGLGFGVFLTVLGLILLYNQFYPLDLTFLYDWWPLVLVGLGAWQIGRYLIARQKAAAAAEDASASTFSTP